MKVSRRQLCRRTNAWGWGFTAAAPGLRRQLVIKSARLSSSSQGGSCRAKETGATGLTLYAHVHGHFTSGPGAAGSGRRSSRADSGLTAACLPTILLVQLAGGTSSWPACAPPPHPHPAFNIGVLLILQLLLRPTPRPSRGAECNEDHNRKCICF